MKKKILYLFILGCIFILPNSIEARSAEACESGDKTTHASVFLTKVNFSTNGKKLSDILRHENSYFSMTLDGYPALCVTFGGEANSAEKYTMSTGTVPETRYSQALNFYIYGDYDGTLIYKWAIAQSIVWHDYNTDIIKEIILLDPSLKKTMQGNEANASKYADKLIGNIKGASTSNTYLWVPDIAGHQSLITTLSGCNEKATADKCPKGKMQKSNPGMECSVAKGGVSFEGFSNSPVSEDGGFTNVHYLYGEERGLSGNKYCRVYCSEIGAATMPGAFGEKLQIGSYMIWPTSENNFNSKFYKTAYPLKFKGKLTCRIGIIPDITKLGNDFTSDMPFSCKDNPLADYANNYQYLNSISESHPLHRKTNITFEIMRKKVTTKVGESVPSDEEAISMCKTAYDDKNMASSEDYRYSKAEKNCSDATNAMDNFKGDKQYKDEFGVEHDTAEWASLKADKESKCTLFESIKNEVEGTCKLYIQKFEENRQILLTYKQCAEYETTDNLYGFSSTATFNYNDEGYNVGDIDSDGVITSEATGLQGQKGLIDDGVKSPGFTFENMKNKYKQEKGTNKDDNLAQIIGKIASREISITKEETYSLYTDYQYLDKDKLEYTGTKPSSSNYISFDKYVIPSSFKNKIGKKYDLTISNIRFGMAGFGTDEQGNGSKYVCHVRFTKQRTPDTCICPEGTANAGKDLTCMNIDQDITCPDAQIQYCEDTSVEIPEECPPGDKTIYCPSPNDNISIGSCINSGMSYADCVAKYCPGAEDIKCPDTYGSSASNMDEQLRDCVQVKMAQGMSKAQAIAVCEPLVCPGGRRIIYRTIRLENPFPSYDSDTKVTQANLQVGMFNNTVKGRYPGSNWNGVLTVYNKIRNNRGTATKDKNTAKNTNKGLVGTTIYQTKTPLYTFVLNGEKISNIRDYNKNQQKGYNDFNLDCTKNNSVACVSSFVHNPLYGLTGGECQNVSKQKSSFYSCAKR